MSFYCSQCGRMHEGFPALAFKAPDAFVGLSDSEKQTIASISGDFCVIDYEDQTDRFIRTIIRLPILDSEEMLEYGVWVSLSKKSFNHYRANFHGNIAGQRYFGFLNNSIPGFPETLNLKMDVVCQGEDDRPTLTPHKDQIGHPFVDGYFDRVSMDFALERLHELIDK